MAFEAARILDRIGCDVKVYDPQGLPVKDDVQHDHPKVQELRDLSIWSEAQFWCSPEQHGNITAVMKNQIDWIPLSTGSVRPTQGRILGFAQVIAFPPGLSYDADAAPRSTEEANHLTLSTLCAFSDDGCACSLSQIRLVAFPSCPRAPLISPQSSLPLAWKNFTPAGRIKPSSNRDRLVDVCEELVKVSMIVGPQMDFLNDRYSEREEKREKGRLLTQAEKEADKDKVVPSATN